MDNAMELDTFIPPFPTTSHQVGDDAVELPAGPSCLAESVFLPADYDACFLDLDLPDAADYLQTQIICTSRYIGPDAYGDHTLGFSMQSAGESIGALSGDLVAFGRAPMTTTKHLAGLSASRQNPRRTNWMTHEDWKRHRAKITRLWRDENRKLSDVRAIMPENHGLQATPKMYRDRIKNWGLQKNIREHEAEAIVQAKVKRDSIGKDTEVFRGGSKIDLARAHRHLKRKGKKSRIIQDTRNDDTILTADARCQHLRVFTPPPNLQAPESLHCLEIILTNVKIWIDGSFETRRWSFDDDGILVLGNASIAIVFNFFSQGCSALASSSNHDHDGFRHLNLAFSHIKRALLEGCLQLPITIATMFFFAYRYLGDTGLRLSELLMRFTEKLSLLILGHGNPLTLIWSALRRMLACSDAWGQAEIFARLVLDSVKSRVVVYDNTIRLLLQDYRRLENSTREKVSLGHHERSLRKQLAALELLMQSKESDKVRQQVQYLTIHLADILWLQDRDEEARSLLLEIIDCAGTNQTVLADALNQLFTMDKWDERYLEAEKTIRRCIEIYDELYGITGAYSLDCLNELASMLRKKGEETRAVETWREYDRRLRMKEEEVGIDTIDKMLEELKLPEDWGVEDKFHTRAL